MGRVQHRRSVYRLGEREYRRRRALLLALIPLILLAVAVIIAINFLKSNTDIAAPPPAVTNKVEFKADQTKTFKEKLFSISLPSNWKPHLDHSGELRPDYSWQGTTKEDHARWVNVYVGRARVQNLGVNRVVEVQGNNGHVEVLGPVSDNCTNFTDRSTHRLGLQTAKWEGISFLCDVGNYARDVVGTVSSDGLNTLTLKNNTSGSHDFFITYTDNSSSPDYTIFTAALQSFKLN